ncbi:MAG TPA: type II toxin-antitoxin system VapC family toxin [Candidatus Methylomirabilis sp.]|nr:type II toxin-antitoxin system VapC family toxin [Candidatus Methylomirabilis sp.]
MKYLLDTNVYIGAVRSDEKRARFRQTFFPLIPATYLSAVVAYELAVSAKDRRTQTLVREFIRPMEQTGRVVTPTFSDWTTAAEVIAAIADKERGWRSKLPALLDDVLIAVSARQIGATLLTYNRDDFLLIRRHLDFLLRVLET